MVVKPTDANTATRQVFLDMRALWIKRFNKERHDSSSIASGKKRLSLKSQADIKQRYVEARKTTSTAVLDHKKHFVEEEFWDETKDGK